MTLTPTDHWRPNIYAFLEQHLRGAGERLRIATGFFSAAGYDLILCNATQSSSATEQKRRQILDHPRPRHIPHQLNNDIDCVHIGR